MSRSSFRNLARTLYTLGDLEGARALLPELVSGLFRRFESVLWLSPREARAAVEAEADRLALALFLSHSEESTAGERDLAFGLLETARLVASASPRAAQAIAADPELASQAREAARMRAMLNDLYAGASREQGAGRELAQEFTRLSRERDRLEREIRSRLAERGVLAGRMDASKLAATLSEGAAAVGYRRYGQWRLDEKSRAFESVDSLLAHVLRADGTLLRVELGPAAEIEELVLRWREAVGAPVASRDPKGATAGAARPSMRALGNELRARILDPLLDAARDAHTLHVCLDDFLHMMPLDALPFERGVVGDRLQSRPRCARGAPGPSRRSTNRRSRSMRSASCSPRPSRRS